MSWRRPERRDEAGSALVIALFFATIFSLLVVSVIDFSATGLKISAGFGAQGRSIYAADGAMNVAINRYASGAFKREAQSPNPCGDYNSPPINGQTVTVRCNDLRAPAGDFANKPANALLSMGGDPAEGIDTTSSNVRVQGNVFSNSTINTVATTGAVTVSGDVAAVTPALPIGDPCPGFAQPTVSPPFTKNCNLGPPGGTGQGSDPGLTAATTAVPVLQTVPACPAAPAWLVTLHPGYYDDASAWNALTNGACPKAVVWLQPGTYYLDFTFRFGATAGLWTVNDKTVNVVAGTPTAWDPSNPVPSQRPKIPVPGGCDQNSAGGVQVIMGGGSHLEVDSGKVEMCASASTTEQQVAVYGLPPAPPNSAYTLKPTMTGSVSGFSSPDNALTIAERPTPLTADASLGSASGMSASLQLSGFLPSVPAGSVVQSVKLVVAHDDNDNSPAPGSLSVTATVPFSGNTCGTNGSQNGVHGLALQPGATPVSDTVDLTACGLTRPSQLSGISVTYTTSLGSRGTSATESLDGINLVVDYRTPTIFKPAVVAASAGFANPNNSLDIGEQPAPLTADAALSSGTPSAALTLAGYGNPPIVPGSTIVSAVLRVVHRDAAMVTPTVTVGTCVARPLTSQTALADDRIDLTANCGVTSTSTLTGLSATYNVGLASGAPGVDSVDGMWLELVYDAPPLTRPAFTAVSSNGFTGKASNAFAIDGATDDANLASTAPGPSSASIDLGGYDHPTLPPGSIIESAMLHIAHQEIDTTSPKPSVPSPPTATVLVSSFAGSTCTAPQTVTAQMPAQDTIDLKKTCGLNRVEQLTGLNATYSTALTGGATTGTAKLDGIVLDLTFRPPAVYHPATATNGGTAPFANPNNAEVIDEQPTPLTADASLTATAPVAPTALLDLTGFGAIPLPPGAVIDQAVLRVAHEDDDTTPPPAPPAPAPPAAPPVVTLAASFPGSTCDGAAKHPVQVLPDHAGALATDVIDLTACGFSTGSTSNPAQTAALRVTYGAELANGTSATDRLDGIEFDLVFRVPAMEPMSGCTAVIPYDPANSATCPLIKSTTGADTGTDQSRFVAQGTVYAPSAPLDFAMTQVSSEVLSRGLIARTIRLGITAAPGYTRPAVGIPPEPVGFSAYPEDTRVPTTVTSSSGFTPPDAGRVIDTVSAAATLAQGGPTSASITVGGFDQSATRTSNPIDGAFLRVVHQDDWTTTPVTVTVAVSGPNFTSRCAGTRGGSPAQQLSVHPGSLVEDQIDLGACGLTSTSQLAGLTVTYTANLNLAGGTSATDYIDGMAIDILSKPMLEASVSFDGSRATIQHWSVLR